MFVSTKQKNKLTSFKLKGKGEILLTGSSIGNEIAAGKVHVILDKHRLNEFKQGEVLVTDMTGNLVLLEEVLTAKRS